MSDLKDRWALVTGASAGIGEAFADAYAARGCNVVLTARREDRLRKHGHWLESKYGIKTMIIVDDLGDAAAPDRLFAATKQAGIHIDILVNNAGYGVPGLFEDAGWAKHAESIQVMVTSVAHLTYLYLPGMQASGFGRIINVASLAGLVPGRPWHTLYAGKKSLLVKFSESLWGENRAKGIHVTATCPGFTYSEFHDVDGTRAERNELPRFMWMDAKSVATRSIAANEAGRPVYTPGLWNKFLAGTAKYVPSPIARAIARSASATVRQQEV